ncbi:MAG TPA: glycosyltransferase, partial [Alphaproteobacteria bacterium]|nr:glycosyltransferase [Alphaproteobacteria bacterium]
FLYRWTLPQLARNLAGGHDFDLIDAHYLYPDGVAAVALGRALARPVVLTARGSDVYTLARFPIPRRLMLRAARQAAGLITVSEALRARLVDLGVEERRIVVLRNGVDLELFHPTPRGASLGGSRLAGPVLASVGHLIPRKGHDIAISALACIPAATLLIVGSGPERARLERLVRTLALGERVRFLGAMPQGDLPAVYGAADALILASSIEGWPNVLLEAMACGTPVVVSNFEGAREIVRTPAAGRIMTARSPAAAAAAVAALLADPPSREATRRYAEGFGWDDTVRAQKAVYAAALARSRAGDAATSGAREGVDE